jgi:predicted dehydrogenase
MSKTTAIIVGAGGMARWHIRSMLQQQRTTRIVGFVEVSEQQRHATRALFADAHRRSGVPAASSRNKKRRDAASTLVCPPFYNSIKELVTAQGAPDAAFIVTPHKFHLENARDCLEAGMDVLLEKPMVLNAAEARRLIQIRDKTKRLLVVAFPGSLSPAIKKAKQLLRDGAIGRVTHVAAWVHQRWKAGTTGTWRQDPKISGGGFLFDTGSHMVNTVLDLIGEDAVEVAALLDRCGTPVEINSSVSGRFRGGAMFSLTGAGDSIQCVSSIMIFGDAGVLETGNWGEKLNIKVEAASRRLMKKRDASSLPRSFCDGQWHAVPYPKSQGVWEQFLKVRAGKMQNPCPAEVGLRFAKFMDMVRESAEKGRTIRM